MGSWEWEVGRGKREVGSGKSALCTVLLDPRDPLLQSERMQGFATDPVYAKGDVFAYVGLPQNLKDLKEQWEVGSGSRKWEVGIDRWELVSERW